MKADRPRRKRPLRGQNIRKRRVCLAVGFLVMLVVYVALRATLGPSVLTEVVGLVNAVATSMLAYKTFLESS